MNGDGKQFHQYQRNIQINILHFKTVPTKMII